MGLEMDFITCLARASSCIAFIACMLYAGIRLYRPSGRQHIKDLQYIAAVVSSIAIAGVYMERPYNRYGNRADSIDGHSTKRLVIGVESEARFRAIDYDAQMVLTVILWVTALCFCAPIGVRQLSVPVCVAVLGYFCVMSVYGSPLGIGLEQHVGRVAVLVLLAMFALAGAHRREASERGHWYVQRIAAERARVVEEQERVIEQQHSHIAEQDFGSLPAICPTCRAQLCREDVPEANSEHSGSSRETISSISSRDSNLPVVSVFARTLYVRSANSTFDALLDPVPGTDVWHIPFTDDWAGVLASFCPLLCVGEHGPVCRDKNGRDLGLFHSAQEDLDYHLMFAPSPEDFPLELASAVPQLSWWFSDGNAEFDEFRRFVKSCVANVVEEGVQSIDQFATHLLDRSGHRRPCLLYVKCPAKEVLSESYSISVTIRFCASIEWARRHARKHRQNAMSARQRRCGRSTPSLVPHPQTIGRRSLSL